MKRSRRPARPARSRRPSRRPARPSPAPAGREEPEYRVRLQTPSDLIAAVPHVLGFHPADSLVLVALVADPARGEGKRRLGPVLRADLTAPGHVGALAATCVRRFAGTGVDDLALVVVGGGEPGPDGAPPRADEVGEILRTLAAAGIEVGLRTWVARVVGGERWSCYPPCDCPGGVVPATDSTPTAAASAVLGRRTSAARSELEATLAPAPGLDDPRRVALYDQALSAALTDRRLAGDAAARRDLAALRHARAEVAAGHVLGDEELARLGAALCDVRVRDACLGWALDDDAADVERFWTVLVRGLRRPEVAEAAVLLAITVLVGRGGALVGVALARALDADPEHRLTLLVVSMLEHGLGPDELRTVVIESERESLARLGE